MYRLCILYRMIAINSGLVKALMDGLPHPAPAKTGIRNGESETDDSDLHVSVSDEDYDQITCQQLGDVVARSARCFGGATVQKISGYLMRVEYDKRLSEGIQIDHVACVNVNTFFQMYKLMMAYQMSVSIR